MGNDKIPVKTSDYDKLLAGLNTCAGRSGKCADVARLEAESRAKEQYIAEHMGGTAERNARMRRDAERLRGTTAHAFADGGSLVLKDKYT